jgi:hypothetical protein
VDLKFAKMIGYHFRAQVHHPDPDSNLPWAFAHAVSALPDPIGKHGICLVDDEPEAFWIGQGKEAPSVFQARGGFVNNPENANQPRSHVEIESRPLVAEQWTASVKALYGRLDRRTGYRNEWVFRHRNHFLIAINSEREWDGDDDWISDDQEKFAQLLAEYLGWHSSS